jgi:hypothetical protein
LRASRSGGPGLGGLSDLLVLAVDPVLVVLDRLGCELRRAELAEERREIAGELPLVVLDRGWANGGIASAGVEPVSGKFSECRLLVAARAWGGVPRRPLSELDLGEQLLAGLVDADLVPAVFGVAERDALVCALDAHP